LSLVCLLGLSGAVAGCSDGPDTVTASKQSNTRPERSSEPEGAPDPGDGGAADSDFCAALADLSSQPNLDSLDDPGAVIEALAALSDKAPADLKDDFDTLSSVVDDLAGLDTSDPENFAKTMELVLRPEVAAASEAISTYALQSCGVDLNSSPGDAESTTVPDGGDGQATGDIDLEDIDAVKDGNAGAPWADKISSTSIINDTDVTIAADDTEMLTADEAMAACTAVRDALVKINPQVVLTVKSGETVVVAAPAGSACAPA
jgi:hypothetical protein